MKLEYAKEGVGYSYTFKKWEKEAIAKGLEGEVKKRVAKVERIRNSNRNEGQATYSSMIAELHNELFDLREIQKEFLLK